VDDGSLVNTSCPISSTPLSSIAAARTAGSWVRVSASNQDAVLGVGPTSGSTIHYCNQMPWNPQRSAIEIVAMDHNAGMQRYMRYNALSNAFELVQADDGAGTATRHGYGHNSVNPFTGDVYHRLAEYGYEGSGPLVRKFAMGGSSFTNLARPTTLFYMQNAIGSCWWVAHWTRAHRAACCCTTAATRPPVARPMTGASTPTTR
jgi:hypothetical protein